MRLSRFIAEHSELILGEFEDFARSHTASGASMDIAALRDHAEAMLAAIALDIQQPQTGAEQMRKSWGDAPAPAKGSETAAEQHGADRAGSGFTLDEMFAEYRALRASVLRLWTLDHPGMDQADMEDMVRFNEGIDQALAESITRYSADLEQSREMFLAILGHDLRTPLSAVLTASSFLATEGKLEGANLKLVERVKHSGERMNQLVHDLLDLTVSRLGPGIPVEPTDTDLAAVAGDAVEEIRLQRNSADIRFEARGDLRGRWDSKRVSQALANLISNAVQHGTGAITVTATGEPEEAVITVHNLGSPIPREDLPKIFDPYKRFVAGGTADPGGSLGLGLFITCQIAQAHGGTVNVDSSQESGTTFALRLPRGND